MTQSTFALKNVVIKPVLRRVRKTAKSDHYLRHVCLSVRMEELGCHCINFHKI